MTTYTIAYDKILMACIPDGADLAAALEQMEANGRIEIDRDTLNVEHGLVLVDEPKDGDEIRWEGHQLGYLTDTSGVSYAYAVRRAVS